ncbi:MAG: bifunctional adenosylcobinamide kinase/adenosylcobinamide-phosphate guanylyltransferase [Mobilicoccus sp.]|nr:bifunctional adenosylcobinamide kinase/adenosylcobinamide-phosphate guanylyltransferase [Mobilicoccus sp.]
MLTFVVGGVRSGKSALAEALLADRPARYVAPGPSPDPARDPEWSERVRLHQERRPLTWTTIETGDVAGEVTRPGPALLVDCLGTWLTRVVDDAEAWEDRARARSVIEAASAELLAALRERTSDVVVVSNEVGLGVVPASPGGRFFRDEMGRLNAAVADLADEVLFVLAGRVFDVSTQPSVREFVAARRATGE